MKEIEKIGIPEKYGVRPDYAECYRMTGHEYGPDGTCKICHRGSPAIKETLLRDYEIKLKLNEVIGAVNSLKKMLASLKPNAD